MKPEREKLISGAIVVFFLLMISLPYAMAQLASNETKVFGGFLLNPIDGNSYLAKMRQGYSGGWTFTLPYTAEPGDGVAINLYYLFLGHVSRTIGSSLVMTFHLARILGSMFLALATSRLFRRVFAEPPSRLFSLAVLLFGSGLGWLAAAFGLFTSDFWVAEAFPFLAGFANAHFPLGLALQVWLITPSSDRKKLNWQEAMVTLAAAAALSIAYPFGWLVAATVVTTHAGISAWQKRSAREDLLRCACLLVGGAPYAAYSFWVVNTHPVLAQWNAQNLTPAPGLIDFVVSFSPALLLAFFGTLAIVQGKMSGAISRLALWFIIGVIIIYLPFSLQRRLVSGLFIPIAGLAIFVIAQLKPASLRRGVALAFLLLSLPTNLLILEGGIQAARRQDPAIFVYREELAAFRWLDENSALNSIVLAGPETGLLIPAYASARVIYGHPFETTNATEQESVVAGFYDGEVNADELAETLPSLDIDYVFYGPREYLMGALPKLGGWQVVYEQGEVQIWAPNK